MKAFKSLTLIVILSLVPALPVFAGTEKPMDQKKIIKKWSQPKQVPAWKKKARGKSSQYFANKKEKELALEQQKKIFASLLILSALVAQATPVINQVESDSNRGDRRAHKKTNLVKTSCPNFTKTGFDVCHTGPDGNTQCCNVTNNTQITCTKNYPKTNTCLAGSFELETLKKMGHVEKKVHSENLQDHPADSERAFIDWESKAKEKFNCTYFGHASDTRNNGYYLEVNTKPPGCLNAEVNEVYKAIALSEKKQCIVQPRYEYVVLKPYSCEQILSFKEGLQMTSYIAQWALRSVFRVSLFQWFLGKNIDLEKLYTTLHTNLNMEQTWGKLSFSLTTLGDISLGMMGSGMVRLSGWLSGLTDAGILGHELTHKKQHYNELKVKALFDHEPEAKESSVRGIVANNDEINADVLGSIASALALEDPTVIKNFVVFIKILSVFDALIPNGFYFDESFFNKYNHKDKSKEKCDKQNEFCKKHHPESLIRAYYLTELAGKFENLQEEFIVQEMQDKQKLITLVAKFVLHHGHMCR